MIFKVSHIFDLLELFSILSLDFLSFSHFQFQLLRPLFIFRMAFEQVLTLLLIFGVGLKNFNSSSKSLWFQKDGYRNWRTTFQDIQKSDLLWKYKPFQLTKIHRCSRFLRSKVLIIYAPHS